MVGNGSQPSGTIGNRSTVNTDLSPDLAGLFSRRVTPELQSARSQDAVWPGLFSFAKSPVFLGFAPPPSTSSARRANSGTFGSRTPFASRNLLSRRTPDADSAGRRRNACKPVRAARGSVPSRPSPPGTVPSSGRRIRSIGHRPGFGRILYADAARAAAAWTRLPQPEGGVYGLLTHLGSSTEDCVDGRPRGAFSIPACRGMVARNWCSRWLFSAHSRSDDHRCWIAISRQVLSTIGAWLYARLSLRADVSLNEARQLARLFQLDLSFRWLPLKEIKQLPRTERRNALLAKLEALGPGRRSMFL